MIPRFYSALFLVDRKIVTKTRQFRKELSFTTFTHSQNRLIINELLAKTAIKQRVRKRHKS